MAGKLPILAIIGPTASGKTALAVALARQMRAEILCVDSMQIYQQMDIGTAKPSLAERFEIYHHLIDWLRPDETFSVARFVELADQVIAFAAVRNVPLIATGGTPMYFKALFEGLFEGPGADESIRDRLRLMPGEQLHQQLQRVDPPSAARIHPADRKRLIRALEIYELTGQPISSLQTDWDSSAPRRQAIWIGLSWEKESLNRRINARVKDMMAAGWVEEVAWLMRHVPNLSRTAAEATGYRELIDHLQGKLPLEEAVEKIKIATRQLARRQMKWFKRFANVHWLPGDRDLQANVREAMGLWTAAAP